MMSSSENIRTESKEIRLYDGPAPGSESWTWEEGVNNINSMRVKTVYNVVKPSLTVFSPVPARINGTGIIICPGGGFHFLAVDHEGTDVARPLVEMGITVFILKYRLVHIFNDNPFDEMLAAKDPKAWDDESLPIIPLAIADGRQALAWVRSHASAYKLVTSRIGIMGFSGGGLVAAATAFNYHPDIRPDFVAPIYADLPKFIQSEVLPDAPPIFLACAQNDEFGFALHAIDLYHKWYAAKRPIELHLFAGGGHGFGMGHPDTASYNWIELFAHWLRVQGFMNPFEPAGTD